MPLFFQGMSDDGILMDVDAAVAHLEGAGFQASQIGIVGFCFGGRVSFLTAVRRKLGAAVGFYGGGLVSARFPIFPALVGEAAHLLTPWLGLFGDQDESIPVADVEQLRETLAREANVPNEIVRYADAKHRLSLRPPPLLQRRRSQGRLEPHARVAPSFEDLARKITWSPSLGSFQPIGVSHRRIRVIPN